MTKKIIEWNKSKLEKLQLLYNQKTPIKIIAEKFGVSKSAIKGTLHRYKLSRPAPKFYEKYDKNFLIHAYIDLGKSTAKIAKDIGCSDENVWHLLKRHNIPTRRLHQRRYTLDQSCFKKCSANKAYLIGFIMADGNISKSRYTLSVKIHPQDIDVLLFLKSVLKTNKPVGIYVNKDNHSLACIDICSQQICNDLAKYHVVPSKTGIEKIPNIPKNIYIIFCVGYLMEMDIFVFGVEKVEKMLVNTFIL